VASSDFLDHFKRSLQIRLTCPLPVMKKNFLVLLFSIQMIAGCGCDKSTSQQVSEYQAGFRTLNAPLFRNAVLSADYLRLESNPQPALVNKDSVYNFLIKVSNTKQVVKIDSASHQDFSSLPTAVRSSGNVLVLKLTPLSRHLQLRISTNISKQNLSPNDYKRGVFLIPDHVLPT